MTLAEKLKSARENAGYSQSQVAERLNISRQAVSRWENGRAYPDIDNLVVLSEIYKVSIDELLKDKSADEQDEVNTEIEVEPEERSIDGCNFRHFVSGWRISDHVGSFTLLWNQKDRTAKGL